MRPYLIAALVALAYGIVGQWDFEEAQRQASLYKEMVCAGAWPDYKQENPDCEGLGEEK